MLEKSKAVISISRIWNLYQRNTIFLITGSGSESDKQKLLWNLLGTLVENAEMINDTISDLMIQYVIPRQYIWVRRRDLYGAELRIGYVESPPYIMVATNDSDIATGNQVSLGNTVN